MAMKRWFFKIAYNQRLCEVAFCNFAKPMLSQGQNQGQNVLDEFFFLKRPSNYTNKKNHLIHLHHK
jgi:hypothetical protein